VQGKATDGLIVTLGRFDTQEQADVEAQRLIAEAAYRDIVVQAIIPPPQPEGAAGAPFIPGRSLPPRAKS
jgi:hypothetical protein